MNGCSIENFGIEIIFGALKQIKSLHSLDIGDNKITSEAIENVVSTLLNNTALQSVCFSNCFIEGELFTALSHAFRPIKTITHLDLGGIIINDKAASNVSFLLTSNAVQYLNISNCNASDAGMLEILSGLEEVVSLEKLVLKCNKLNDNLAEKLYSIIKKNNQVLRHLNLSKCNLSHFQVMSFIALAPCSIQHLDLSFNAYTETLSTIPDRHDSIQSPSIKHDSLKHLNLHSCGLTETMMNDTLLMLSGCTSIEFLNLNSCIISESKSFGCIITDNSHLKYLNLSDCKLQEQQIIDIAKSLRTGRSIEHLLLSSNVITDIAAEEISYTIYSVPSLKQLSLSGCKMEELGLLYIANYLQLISSLQYLDLSYNAISF